MPRPDPSRIQRQARVTIANAGETATLRQYISATPGTPRFGAGPTYNYNESLFSGVFAFVTPKEAQAAGGMFQAGQLAVTTESQLSERDEIMWRGTAYRLDGQPIPQNLGGRVLWRSPLKLAGTNG